VLRRLYEAMKTDHATRTDMLAVPPPYRSTLVCVGGSSEQIHVTAEALRARHARRVLVVCVFGGRDYFALRALGFDVDGLDLAQPHDFPPIHVGNVEDAATLPAGPYDAIVLAEVIEHLRDDARALVNLRSRLRPDGLLVLTVPFLHDAPETHLRVHTPKSIRRLLAVAGFRIVATIYRPGPFVLRRPINLALHALSALAFLTTRRTLYAVLLPPLWRLYTRLGRHERLHRRSRAFGATILATPSDVDDHIARNRRDFLGQH
jgi:SAM-dependent methyltransferase